MTPPNLLNDDGRASIATALMMSHHGFRRDLARFGAALERVRRGDHSRIEALKEEWRALHAALHAHHEAEDGGVFPSVAEKDASVKATLERLSADHRKIDPLLERGDRGFDALPDANDAADVVRTLRTLLDEHLAIEEAAVIPFVREMTAFPPPPDEEAAAMYAQGFAWCMQGIAPTVIDRVYEMLPEILVKRLPAARAAFEVRCQRVWGSSKAGSATTPIPSPIDTTTH
jgi:hemerythrin-like domain-containing protein